MLKSNASRFVLGALIAIAALEYGLSGKLGAVVTLAFNPNGAWLYGWDPVQYYSGKQPGTSNQSARTVTNPVQMPVTQTL